jgi:hypothetical protein
MGKSTAGRYEKNTRTVLIKISHVKMVSCTLDTLFNVGLLKHTSSCNVGQSTNVIIVIERKIIIKITSSGRGCSSEAASFQ